MLANDLYYKIARPDGWDFYTGKTINYRAAIGKEVVPPQPNPSLGLCSAGVIHASRIAEDCFQGGHCPCSLFVVQGTPVCSDATKSGFTELLVIEELQPADFFKWRYAEASVPLNPLILAPAPVDDEIIGLLNQWASVRASVWASVRASVRASVGDSTGAYVGYLFAPVVPKWKTEYPFQASIELWKRGLVPGYDGNIWRLHGGADAQVLYTSPQAQGPG